MILYKKEYYNKQWYTCIHLYSVYIIHVSQNRYSLKCQIFRNLFLNILEYYPLCWQTIIYRTSKSMKYSNFLKFDLQTWIKKRNNNSTSLPHVGMHFIHVRTRIYYLNIFERIYYILCTNIIVVTTYIYNKRMPKAIFREYFWYIIYLIFYKDTFEKYIVRNILPEASEQCKTACSGGG